MGTQCVVFLCPPSRSQPGLSCVPCPSPAAWDVRGSEVLRGERLFLWRLLRWNRQGRTRPNSLPCPLFRKLAEGPRQEQQLEGKPRPRGRERTFSKSHWLGPRWAPSRGSWLLFHAIALPGRGEAARARVRAGQRTHERTRFCGGQNAMLRPPRCVTLGKSLLSEPQFAQT